MSDSARLDILSNLLAGYEPPNAGTTMTDDALIRLLAVICDRLDALGVKHAVTGSVASSVHGQPVGSLDVDIGLRMTLAQADQFADSLPPGIYRSIEGLREAVRTNGMSNVIDIASQFKADLSVLPPEPFYDNVLERRQRIAYAPGGPTFWTVTAEDIILMKLVWRVNTRSKKQWDNALSVAHAKGARLDWKYLRQWATELSVAEDLQQLQQEAGI